MNGQTGMIRNNPTQLDAIIPRLDPTLFGSMGVRRWPEREADRKYYLARATPLAVEWRMSNLLVRLQTPEGDTILATLPRFNNGLLGQFCWVVLSVHPAEDGRWHRHIIRLWPCESPAESYARSTQVA
jgi:hypothetical protein